MTTALYELEDETTSLEYLVEAAQAGDRDAFGELATRFEPMVYAIAVRRLGNHSEAQEPVSYTRLTLPTNREV